MKKTIVKYQANTEYNTFLIRTMGYTVQLGGFSNLIWPNGVYAVHYTQELGERIANCIELHNTGIKAGRFNLYRGEWDIVCPYTLMKLSYNHDTIDEAINYAYKQYFKKHSLCYTQNLVYKSTVRYPEKNTMFSGVINITEFGDFYTTP